jgi:hypothetical protein
MLYSVFVTETHIVVRVLFGLGRYPIEWESIVAAAHWHYYFFARVFNCYCTLFGATQKLQVGVLETLKVTLLVWIQNIPRASFAIHSLGHLCC